MTGSRETKKVKILVVDDEESIRDFLQIMLKRDGHLVSVCASGKEALKLCEKEEFSVLVTDIAMPEMNGIELLQKLKQKYPGIAVIVMTAHGSAESAVQAMKLGAEDYLTKPFQIDEMRLAIENSLNSLALKKENRELRTELGKSFSFENIVANTPAMHEIFDLIRRVSQTKASILILGESGTGKELIARAIHYNSPEKDAPFVVINCGAIPENLLESELFGHKRGSFTGAVADKKGLFQMADGGTLFLDEIGELPLPMQVKLLRAIQTRSFHAVGGTEDISVDVRIVAATNRDLEADVKRNVFREDLYYRLNVIQIRLPPLRERKEDIPLLAQHFLSKYNLSMGKAIKSISKEALQYLQSYNYPGNIRELENIVERAVALETKASIFPESLPQKLTEGISPAQLSPVQSTTEIAILPETFDLEKNVVDFEKKFILRALEQSGGVKKKAAKLLGISFRSLRYRIEKYGITDPNPDEQDK